jgi:uncharacterized membrane protein SpoIIM required for sporulation
MIVPLTYFSVIELPGIFLSVATGMEISHQILAFSDPLKGNDFELQQRYSNQQKMYLWKSGDTPRCEKW